MSDQTNTEVDHSLMGRLASLALWLAGIALVGMVLAQGWQVIARYVLNDSPSWTEPLALLLINTAMMFSAAVAVRRHSHFAFQILLDTMPGGVKRVLQSLNLLVIALIGGLLAWYGAVMVLDGWPIKIAGAELRQGVMYVPMLLGGMLMVIFALEQLLATTSTEVQS